MEQVRDLNMEADDIQVVLSAISGVSKRIKEVAQTHKPLAHFLAHEEVLTAKERLVCLCYFLNSRAYSADSGQHHLYIVSLHI